MPIVILGAAVIIGLLIAKGFTAGPLANSQEAALVQAAKDATINSQRPWLLVSSVGMNSKEKACLDATATFFSKWYGKTIVEATYPEFLKDIHIVWKKSGHGWLPYGYGWAAQGNTPVWGPYAPWSEIAKTPDKKGYEYNWDEPKVYKKFLEQVREAGPSGLHWEMLYYADQAGNPNSGSTHVIESPEQFIAMLQPRVASSWSGGM